MIRPFLVLTLVVALAGCASRWNPFNWFRGSVPAERVEGAATPGETRPLVAVVESLAIEQTSTGAIVRATGLTPTQGWWNAALVAKPVGEDGRLVLDFRIAPPPAPTGVNSQRSREVTVAYALSRVKLETIREIVVQGEINARALRR